MVQRRETAWRTFAAEFNGSNLQYAESGERAPSYLVTPLGARINRIFVCGVLTEVERMGAEEEPFYRGRVADPTGSYFISAGQYQPEAAAALSRLQAPAFVAVVGKVRVYSPEPGVTYVSIRAELVTPINGPLRDLWVLQTCQLMRQRIEAVSEATRMASPSIDKLVELGYPPALADGVMRALDHYGPPDLARYRNLLADGLRYVLPEFAGERSDPALSDPLDGGAGNLGIQREHADVYERVPVADEPVTEADEERLLGIIEQLQGAKGSGAEWKDIIDKASVAGMDRDLAEEALNLLQDKGLVCEPEIGRLRLV